MIDLISKLSELGWLLIYVKSFLNQENSRNIENFSANSLIQQVNKIFLLL